ncbi:MAG: hypothetical protein WAW79_09275 [Steroidobacteraceae bacterium]
MALLSLAAGAVLAPSGVLATNNEAPAVEAAPVQPAEDAAAEIKEEKPFKIPPGFRTKTRGEKTVYCRMETLSGSRFGSETCFTEEQLRAIAEQNEAQKQEIERNRRACASDASCAS